MLVRIVDKQRQAVKVIKTALLSVGMIERAVCVQVDSRRDQYEGGENYSVFVSAPTGANIEPFYVTGKTLVEAVNNMICSIKIGQNSAKTEVSERAPF
ncbi:MAG: hypothetical protein Q8L79_17320 [Methylobacter sp.]|uniref:hypothetical protein n=1 Tax=Methylobacter sp. TaxID=2051955 RepID=UPI002731E55D|nr:hypothetical protein [Methylobacter sp.]MDP1666872.1 hypothetical protein [Methylobacter sp.]